MQLGLLRANDKPQAESPSRVQLGGFRAPLPSLVRVRFYNEFLLSLFLLEDAKLLASPIMLAQRRHQRVAWGEPDYPGSLNQHPRFSIVYIVSIVPTPLDIAPTPSYASLSPHYVCGDPLHSTSYDQTWEWGIVLFEGKLIPPPHPRPVWPNSFSVMG